MASAIRSAGALRRRLPLLLRSSTGSLLPALGEEQRCMARFLIGNPRLFSSGPRRAASSYKHLCKYNLGCQKHMEGQLANLNILAKEDALGWRTLKEDLEASLRRQAEQEEVYKRQDRVVACAAAAVFLFILGNGNVFFVEAKGGTGRVNCLNA